MPSIDSPDNLVDHAPHIPEKEVHYLFKMQDRDAFLMALLGKDKMNEFLADRADVICHYRINEEFLENKTHLMLLEENGGLDLTQIEEYSNLKGIWGNQSYTTKPTSKMINAESTGYGNDMQLSIEYELAPEMEKNHTDLAVPGHYTWGVYTQNNTAMQMELYEYPEAGLNYIVLSPMTNYIEGVENANAAEASAMIQKNAESTTTLIDHFFQQGLLEPMTETPLEYLQKKLKL